MIRVMDAIGVKLIHIIPPVPHLNISTHCGHRDVGIVTVNDKAIHGKESGM
jgi:hypothetical protein